MNIQVFRHAPLTTLDTMSKVDPRFLIVGTTAALALQGLELFFPSIKWGVIHNIYMYAFLEPVPQCGNSDEKGH